MIPLVIKTESTARLGRDSWRQASKDAWSAAGDAWHERVLPKHFEFSAIAEYDYAPRTPKYMKAKAKSKGHQQPLVWKGELKRMVLRMRDVTAVRARGDDEGGVKVKLSGPRYLHQRQQPKQPNLALELSTLSQRDADAIALVLDERVSAVLNGNDAPRDAGQ